MRNYFNSRTQISYIYGVAKDFEQRIIPKSWDTPNPMMARMKIKMKDEKGPSTGEEVI